MKARDDNIRLKPGRIRDKGLAASNLKSFVAQVMRAAKKAGHSGRDFGRSGSSARSTFGRGRAAAVAASLRSPARRVVIKARVVRHRSLRFRSAPLSQHLAYLKRDGVSRDGEPARMFDVNSDAADERDFTERTADDRHHFRFIVSPEDATEMADLRAFTRDLMRRAEQDLGSRLDWVAVDHWNTDNPHIHVLARGVVEDGADLVISRDYISRGLRGRAEQLVALELGPRTDQEVSRVLESEVTVERWTGLDRALRAASDESGGLIDLRPGGGPKNPELRRLMIGRAMKLERLGLAAPVGPASWTLKAGHEETLRELALRGDIIKTMHRALAREGRSVAADNLAIHGKEPPNILGRLADRGLHDELTGSAYVVIEGVDGRAHHLRFADLAATGDAASGTIVEARSFEGADGRRRLTLAVRSDLSLDQQVTAPGATWLDRQLVVRESTQLAGGGFGLDVRESLERRIDHLASEGLAKRQGQRVVFARDLLDMLRRRELDQVTGKLAAEMGLAHMPVAEGDHVAGIYRQRLSLASGRFAMIDNGLGFELLPWKPALEQKLGPQVSGVMLPGGGVDWSFGRKRGLGL